LVSISHLINLQPDYSESGLLIISRGTAILLLIVYIAYLIFQVVLISYITQIRGNCVLIVWQLKTHNYLFIAPDEDEDKEEPKMSTVSAGSAYVYFTRYSCLLLVSEA
jgi:Ca2+:H+ antiporter